MKSISTFLCLALAFLFILSDGYSQGFVRTYPTPIANREGGNALRQMPDGGYLIAGTQINPVTNYDAYLLRVDANGDTLWKKNPGNPFYSLVITTMEETPDSAFILAGYAQGTPGQDFYWSKVDRNGNLIWENYVASPGYDYAYSITHTSDNGYVMCGYGQYAAAGSAGIYVVKIDSVGDTVWTRAFAPGTNAFGYWITETLDQGLFITGYATVAGSGQMVGLKLNAQGNLQWQWIGSGGAIGYAHTELPNGDLILAGAYPFRLDKLDSAGNYLSGRQITSTFEPRSMVLAQDGRIAMGGMYNSSFKEFGLVICDTALNVLNEDRWRRRTDNYIQGWRNVGLIETADHGFAMTHVWAPLNYPTDSRMDAILIKTDSLGRAESNLINGYVYADDNSNCQIDGSDFPVPNLWVELNDGQNWQMTDPDGYYSFETGTGPQKIKVYNTLPNLAHGCPAVDSQMVNFSMPQDTIDSLNFAMEILDYCPYLTVDVTSGITRPGFPTTINVTYCNQGFTTATNVPIEVQLGSFMNYVSSTIPATALGGGLYGFTIPSLPSGYCNSFSMVVNIDTNATLNATSCVEALIYPDTVCGPQDTTWDRSSVSVEGGCVNDSLACFTIYNTGDPGNGDMDGPTPWRMFVNGVLTQTGTVQINGGDSTVLCFPAMGNTIRLEVDQRPGHPGNSHPNDAVELCDTTGSGSHVLGQITQMPQNIGDPYVDIHCRQIVNSYDPNEKRVFPEGLTSAHYVSPGTPLTYEIHFQNTGTAPAVNVILKDTLPAELNPGTLRLIGSSHPYTDFQMLPGGILQWRFLNINLPDSTNNEPQSHGYVAFRIQHTGGLAIGSRIENRAGIYFDFNDPVITDWSFVTLHDTVITHFTDPVAPEIRYDLIAWPNPGNGIFHFRLDSDGQKRGNYALEIYDLTGRKVHSGNWDGMTDYDVDLTDNPNGMYVFRLTKDGRMMGSGRICIQ